MYVTFFFNPNTCIVTAARVYLKKSWTCYSFYVSQLSYNYFFNTKECIPHEIEFVEVPLVYVTFVFSFNNLTWENLEFKVLFLDQ